MHTQTYVYQYGLLPPTVNAELVDEHLWASHRLYNDMIEIQRKVKEKTWALERDLSTELDTNVEAQQQAKTEREDLRDQINTLKGNKPAGKEDKAAHRQQVKDLQAKAKPLEAQLKALRERAKEIRKELRENPLFVEPRQAFFDDAKVKDKVLYKDTIVFWPTYNLIKSAVDQAKQKFGMPNFKRWDGESQIGVQLQKKASPAEVFNGNTFLQIDPVDPRAFDPNVPKGQRKKLTRTKLRMRLGTVKGTQKPIWAEWPLILHRDFPEGTTISSATINRRKHANKDKWTVQITIAVPAVVAVLPESPKAVALDLGWRKLGSGELRTFYWGDTEGNTGELKLPLRVREGLQKARDIRGIRDQHQDTMKATLLKMFKDRASLDPELRKEVQSLHKWKSPKSFTRLWNRHKDVMPEKARELLRVWLCGTWPEDKSFGGDRHLWRYETGRRSRALNHRKAVHNNFAHWLASTYDVIVLEKFRLTSIKKKAKPERKALLSDNMAAMNNASSRQRDEAAPGYARRAIKNAARKAGKIVIEVDARNTTKMCASCGHKGKWEVPHELIHTCSSCGETFDRDANAVRNILTKGMAAVSKIDPSVDLKPKEREKKWSKRHKPAETEEAA